MINAQAIADQHFREMKYDEFEKILSERLVSCNNYDEMQEVLRIFYHGCKVANQFKHAEQIKELVEECRREDD